MYGTLVVSTGTLADRRSAPAIVSASLPFASMVVCGAVVLGVFLPTSLDGTFRPMVDVGGSALAAAVLIYYRISMPAPNWGQMLGASALVVGLLVGTVTSPFSGAYSPGLLPTFAGIVLLVVSQPIRLSERSANHLLTTIRVAGTISAGWVAALIIGVAPVQQLTVRLFPAYYQELVPFMVADHRPVTSWGTHSVAAFFYFLMTLFFRQDFLATGRRRSIVLSMFYVAAMFGLRSVSGLALGGFSIVVLLMSVLAAPRGGQERVRARRVTIAIASVGVIVLVVVGEQLAGAASKVLDFNFGGFSGRYDRNYGRIYPTIQWLQNNPFRPIGFTESTRIVFGDSGPVDYFLRGGFLAVVGVYSALLITLRRFILQTQLIVVLSTALLLFELGFSALPIWRLQLILVPYLLAMRRLGLLRHGVSAGA